MSEESRTGSATVNPTSDTTRPRLGRLLVPRIVLLTWTAWCCSAPRAALLLAAQPGSSPSAWQVSPTNTPAGAADAIAPKVRRYAEHLLRRYDKSGDGQIQPDEWGKMHGNPEAADANRDHVITLDELTRYIAAFGQHHRLRMANATIGGDAKAVSGTETPARQESTQGGPSANPEDATRSLTSGAEAGPAPGTQPKRDTTFYVPRSRLPAGLPEWFLRRDTNGDGQVSLSEFAPNPTQADLGEFARYDKNGDGFITARECLDTLKPAKSASGKAAGAASGKTGEKSGAKATRKKP